MAHKTSKLRSSKLVSQTSRFITTVAVSATRDSLLQTAPFATLPLMRPYRRPRQPSRQQGTEVDKMASAMIPNRQHIGTPNNINPSARHSLLSPTKKRVLFVPTTRITSPTTIRSKYKPRYIRTTEERYYRKLRAANPLAFKQLTMNTIAAKASGAPQSSNISLRRVAGPRSFPLATPPVTMLCGEHLLSIDEVSNSNSPHTPVNKVYKGSPLDKELPPKPMLRFYDGTERRDLIDMPNNDFLTLDYPVLQPESSNSSDGDSFKSFEMASSVDSLSTVGDEIETYTAIMVEGEIVNSITCKDFAEAKIIDVMPIRISNSDSSTGRVKGLTSMGSSGSLNRRAARYNVGPTLRKTSDCHAVIMGPSPHPPRTSSLPKPVKSTGQLSAASRLSRPTAASAARAAEAKKTLLNPRKTFLNKGSASKSSLLSSAHKFVAINTPSQKPGSRLSGSKTSLTTSTTANSFKKASKGLKSRFSEMFSGRRHTTVYSNANIKGNATIADNKDVQLLTSPISDTAAKRASKLITTYRNSGMNHELSSTENLHGEKTEFMGKLSDKEPAPCEQRRHEREERRTSAAAGNMVRASGGIGGAGAVRARRDALVPTGDGDEPPTPPPTRGGPAGHYGDGDAEDEDAEHGTEDMTEAEFDLHLTTQLDQAEVALREAIETANGSGVDDESMVRVNAVLNALGNSIVNSRQVLMAGIELRAATTNLIEWSATRADIARAAVNAAVLDYTTLIHGDRFRDVDEAAHERA